MRNVLILVVLTLISEFVLPASSFNISSFIEAGRQLDKTSADSILVKIFNNLFGGDTSKIGFLAAIPVAIISAIIWGKIFLVIYYVFWKDKDSYGGGSSGQQQYQYGRALLDVGIDKTSKYVFNAIEKFGDTY